MTTGETLERYLGAARTLSQAEFADAHAHPFLVQVMGSAPRSGPRAPRHQTMRVQVADLDMLELPEDDGFKNRLVYALPPAERSRTLRFGRDETAELQHDGGAVSKEHARLIVDAESGDYLLLDAGSTNGTFVNGTRLQPDERRVLADGDLISFGGQHDFQFCLPWSFHELLLRGA